MHRPSSSQPEGSQYLASGRLEAGLGQVCVKAIIQIQIFIFWKNRFEKLRFWWKWIKSHFQFFHADGPFTLGIKKLEIFQRSPRTPDSMMRKIVIFPNNVFSHTTSLQEGGRGFFQFFYSKREERNDKFLFFTFMFCVKKTFLEKKLSFFVIFLISIFRFFGEKNVIQKKVLFTH